MDIFKYEQDSLAADYAYRNAVAKTPEEINKAWQASIQADLAVHTREEQGWNTLRVRAEMTLDEMQSRLPDAVIPKDKTTLSLVRMAVRDGMLAGANPLGTTATYFETLARLLPQVKVPASRGARKR